MANPLKAAAAPAPIGPLKPGDTFTVIDRTTGDVVGFERTHRSFAEDYVDAMNDTMSVDAKKRGLVWYVDASGHPKLGDNPAASARRHRRTERKAEYDREQWKQRNGLVPFAPSGAMDF